MQYRSTMASLYDTGDTHERTFNRTEHATYRDEHVIRAYLAAGMDMEEYIGTYSRSYYDHAEHMKHIFSYSQEVMDWQDYNPAVQRKYEQAYEQAVTMLIQDLSSHPMVEVLDIFTDEIYDIEYNSASSAGYSYVGSKGVQRGPNHLRAKQRARASVGNVKDGGQLALAHEVQNADPYMAYTRTQLVDVAVRMKTRNVWGQAFHRTLIEGSIQQPLTAMFANLPYDESFYFIGKDPLIWVPIVLNYLFATFLYVYLLDWHSLDSSLKRYEMRSAFKVLETKVILDNDGKRAAFALGREQFITKKVAAPDKKIYGSSTGGPSGSGYIHIVDSICTKLRFDTIVIVEKGAEFVTRGFYHGDDNATGLHVHIPMDRWQYHAHCLHWELNPKSRITTSIEGAEFLQRMARGTYSARLISKIRLLACLPEYEQKDIRVSKIRLEMAYRDSGSIDPLTQVASRILAKETENMDFSTVSLNPSELRRFRYI